MEQIKFLNTKVPSEKLKDDNNYNMIFECIINNDISYAIDKIEFRMHLYNTIKEAYEHKLNSIKDVKDFLREIESYTNLKLFYIDKVKYDVDVVLNIIDFIINQCFTDELRNNNEAINTLVDKTFFSIIISSHYNAYTKIPFRYKNFGTAHTTIKDDTLLGPKEYATFFINNYDVKTPVNCKLVYKFFVPEIYQYDADLIKAVIDYKPYILKNIFEYIEKIPGLAEEIIDEHRDYYQKNINYVPANLKDYTLNGSSDNSLKNAIDKVAWLETNNHSTLYEKLVNRFEKSFLERHPDFNKNDKIRFIYALLNSNVIEMIYKDDFFDKNDLRFITSFINYLDKFDKSYDTTFIKSKMESLKTKYTVHYNKMYNDLTNKEISFEDKEKILQTSKVNKFNVFSFVFNQKYWDRKQKTSVLNALERHYQIPTCLSLLDYIDIKLETESNKKTQNTLFNENNFDYHYYEKGKKWLKDNEPIIMELINNDNIDLKELKRVLKLYNTIMHLNITSRQDFIDKFKKSPEEVLALFDNYKIQFDGVNQKLTMIIRKEN